jgi:uncharacterized protein (DUF1330 family)
MTAYVVMIRERLLDEAEFAIYAEQARSARSGHPVTPLASYGSLEVLEGPAIEGTVILSFPTMEDAKRWYESPAYQAARAHRFRGAEYRVFLTEGIKPASDAPR